ncbi:hypothetical protein NM688_g7265 [Phlebia brevispora]|uniref:Uncharacterized protein n=1 Tax=Phlebia brevispora TaxID=194682 RepID=A0ACC1S7B7_9APHY|nr:hypothetical protein NM688_g7265 [Phlebia brevispora]
MDHSIPVQLRGGGGTHPHAARTHLMSAIAVLGAGPLPPQEIPNGVMQLIVRKAHAITSKWDRREDRGSAFLHRLASSSSSNEHMTLWIVRIEGDAVVSAPGQVRIKASEGFSLGCTRCHRIRLYRKPVVDDPNLPILGLREEASMVSNLSVTPWTQHGVNGSFVAVYAACRRAVNDSIRSARTPVCHSMQSGGDKRCGEAFITIGMVIAETILTIRTWALWEQNYWIKTGLLAILAIFSVTFSVFTTISLLGISYDSVSHSHSFAGCRILHANSWAVRSFMEILIYELIFTAVKGLSHYRLVGMRGVARVAYRDGKPLLSVRNNCSLSAANLIASTAAGVGIPGSLAVGHDIDSPPSFQPHYVAALAT